MKQLVKVLSVLAIAAGMLGCIASPIEMTPQTQQRLQTLPPIRFLLTFDDGPSASSFYNPTDTVLDSLARNALQPDIKAVFFVQTGAPRAGASDIGRRVMHREHDAGQVLGFHTATHWHTNHRSLSPVELEQSLSKGIADIAAITGASPTLVRPPFWNYDKRTFAAYQQHGLHVLLTDLSANDGKIWGFNGSPRRRANMLRQMSEVRERIAGGELPTVEGVIPVVVTFHDINRYTARHTREYLKILLDSASTTGVTVATKPFYDDEDQLLRAAMARTVSDTSKVVQLPGIWNWFWDGDSH
ncbi:MULTISPECIES: polysaccharide deacetylase family protein [unclassified Pseudomonas]|uniref:polysaccharide deacetylase family protein n=1 Tax=unclassified Pseudomonas TaxID=196821 RepID=UPI002AC8C0B6|nr:MULTISPECIES: polysaccharide deacetylase family protein [unclassified Pseudomonas]MEB0048501.1 polysaccharide deacetylase family protein [Pseudomonas sp. Dout3]MEB0099364.1 polysaccharide deacetylase family protein [Pseudomonas sp. DC1.2]WPX61178.1 polysaccharide deacetylase family protein [Pseudomonas sp. DC1.2]